MPFDATDSKTREKLLAMVFNQARDMMVVSRVEPEVLFRTVSVNRTYLNVVRSAGIDVTLEAVEGRTFQEIMDLLGFEAGTVNEIKERYLRVMRTCEPLDFEESTTTPRGVFYGSSTITPLLDQAGRCAYFIYSSRDVTDQRRAEVDLRESEAKFAATFQVSPSAMMLADLRSGTILEVNESFERITGYRRSEVMGRTALELGLIDDALGRERRVQRLLQERTLHGERARYRRKDGQWIEALGSAALVKLAGRVCILNTVEDITHRLRVEQERSEYERHLRHSQKLEGLGTLAGGIAHDFNNILTALLANCELGLLDINETREVKGRLEAIQRSGLRARDLVRRILTFSRQQAHERSTVSLDGLMGEVKSMLESSLPSSIRVVLDLPEQVEPILADAGQMHQVLLNLATNAGQAMRENGGELSLRLGFQNVSSERSLELALGNPGRFAVIQVQDQGAGIPLEIQHRIFEPFFTTKGPGEGTGLGLAMVHGIVRDHGGAVLVESKAGVGTTMQVWLPVQVGTPVRKGLTTESLPQGKGEWLLLVDDEPSVSEIMRRLLVRVGYQVQVCESAEAAWSVFEAEPDRFALLLTDLTMPGWSGLELVQRVHALRPRLPVCMMTGYAGGLNQEDLDRLGGCEIINKPVDLSELAHRLHAALSAP